eukprot:4193098-Ditylum_brightwellii.AAC.1
MTGEMHYKGKLGNDRFDKEGVTKEWVERNFGDKFVEYYYKLQDKSNFNTWLGVPKGFRGRIDHITDSLT